MRQDMSWQDFLRDQGAQVSEDGAVQWDGVPGVAALDNGAVLVPLAHFGLIRFAGEATLDFLQGQLSSDVKKLAAPGCQYSSYSTPKGRMLATFLLTRLGDDVLLALPRSLLPAIQKRLSMYILRSKTKAVDASDELALLGLAGPQAGEVAAAVFGVPLPAPFAVMPVEGGWLAGLPDSRVLVAMTTDRAPACWAALTAAGAQVAGTTVWDLSDIRAGIPWVWPATQEEFVPQMANMELIGAVSFKKGCYPGQEIVARTQYLGKLKRRTFRVASPVALVAGQPVFSAEMNGQASGVVAQAAPARTGWEALVVAQIASVEHGLHVDSVTGPALTVLPLPYPLGE
jgi:hypothetical protein